MVDAPPGDELGLDAEGGAGSDGFGLRAKKGGRGLIGGGDRNRWYEGQVQRDLFLSEEQLAQSDSTVSTSLIALYKALGGGWNLPDEKWGAAP